MTFGRPASIPDNYTRLEPPNELIDEETGALNPFSSALGGSFSVHFFTATMYAWLITQSRYRGEAKFSSKLYKVM
jgi:hypothetical protein